MENIWVSLALAVYASYRQFGSVKDEPDCVRAEWDQIPKLLTEKLVKSVHKRSVQVLDRADSRRTSNDVYLFLISE